MSVIRLFKSMPVTCLIFTADGRYLTLDYDPEREAPLLTSLVATYLNTSPAAEGHIRRVGNTTAIKSTVLYEHLEGVAKIGNVIDSKHFGCVAAILSYAIRRQRFIDVQYVLSRCGT